MEQNQTPQINPQPIQVTNKRSGNNKVLLGIVILLVMVSISLAFLLVRNNKQGNDLSCASENTRVSTSTTQPNQTTQEEGIATNIVKTVFSSNGSQSPDIYKQIAKENPYFSLYIPADAQIANTPTIEYTYLGDVKDKVDEYDYYQVTIPLVSEGTKFTVNAGILNTGSNCNKQYEIASLLGNLSACVTDQANIVGLKAKVKTDAPEQFGSSSLYQFVFPGNPAQATIEKILSNINTY